MVIWIAMSVTTHPLRPTLVLFHHLLRLFGLVLIVRRAGFVELLARILFLMFQLSFRFPYGTRLACTRAKQQDHNEQSDNENSSFSHRIEI